ncbi:MAG: PAS domain S-box protein [Pseudomonadota bacterium]
MRTEIALNRSFCAHAARSEGVFLVEDAAADSRFGENPFVKNAPYVRFYAGAPIRTPNGETLGALSVLDCTPRALSPGETETLAELAHFAADAIEDGRRRRDFSVYEPITEAVTRIQTARLDAEAALRASEVKNRAVLDNIVDGIITIDETGRVLDYNRACGEIFGYGPEETIGQNIRMLMPPGYSDRHDGYISAYRRTGRKKIIGIGRKVEGRRKDGSTFPIQLSVSEVAINGVPHYTGIVRDISLEKASEQALRDSEERFALAAQGASVGIWDWIDVNAGQQWWSPIFDELLGYAEGRPGASIESFRRLLHPDDRERTFGAIEAHLEHGEAFRLEFRLHHKSKGFRWFLGSAVASGDIGGRPRRMTGSIMDIHELKLTQQVLQLRSDTLEQTNRELDHFAYVASHDLRAPLRGMDNVTQWIEEDLGDDASDNVKEKLRLLRGRVGRMDRLLTDILAFSRAGKQESEPEPVDCAALLSEIVGWVDPPNSFTLKTKGMPPQICISRTLPST